MVEWLFLFINDDFDIFSCQIKVPALSIYFSVASFSQVKYYAIIKHPSFGANQNFSRRELTLWQYRLWSFELSDTFSLISFEMGCWKVYKICTLVCQIDVQDEINVQGGKFLENIKHAGRNRRAGWKFSGKSIIVQVILIFETEIVIVKFILLCLLSYLSKIQTS